MKSNNGEYIIVDFKAEELAIISERAEYLAKAEEIQSLWKQAYWQLSLAANHLSIVLQIEEKDTDEILKDYEQE